MLLNRRKVSEAAVHAAERRERESAAGLLLVQVPRLATLEIAVEERRGDIKIGETRHVRRFVVNQAPALFEMRCTDRRCTEGGHDLTWQVMNSLRAMAGRFEGEHTCDGNIGQDGCDRVLRFIGTATYRD